MTMADLSATRGSSPHDIHPYGIGDLARDFGVTLRSLRFYEDRGLLAPLRDGLTRRYSRKDHERVALILRGKRLGFTLVEIREMIDEPDRSSAGEDLTISRDKVLAQIEHLEKQRDVVIQALEELRAAYDQCV